MLHKAKKAKQHSDGTELERTEFGLSNINRDNNGRMTASMKNWVK
jgi:hypothetical protein